MWAYMERVEGADTVVCLVCKDSLKYSGSTSTMMKHLRVKHPLEYAELKENSETAAELPRSTVSSTVQPTLTETIDRTQAYKNDSTKKKELDRLVMRMIAKDLRPLSTVEDDGFRRLVHGLNPRYELPSRRELTRTLLPLLYNQEVEIVSQELDKAKYVSLTTDIWTSRQTQGFITVTAHFISPDWILKSVVLETARITDSHTGENIAEELTRICNKWNILDKLCSVVADNASNMISAIKRMKQRYIPCFAHTLNLVVQDSLKNTEEVQAIKEKVKNIVTFFHHSVKASDKLCHLQEQNKLPAKKLIQDVPTRWNSTFYMLERFAEQSELVTTTLCLLGKKDMCISDGELELIHKTVKTLEPFEELTREMSTEKLTSVSKVIPIVRGMQEFMNSGNGSNSQQRFMSFPLMRELRTQMSERFPTMESGPLSLGAATLLDPRFKKIPFANESNVKTTEDRLINLMRSSESDEEPSTSKAVLPARQVPAEVPRKKSFWNTFDAKVEKIAQTSQPSTGPYIELRRYLEEAPIPRQEDPLAWWKEHAALFPRLNGLAKRFLCIPASSVPAERLFSKAGELVSQRRCSLKDTNVNMILFLNKNMS